MSWSDRRAILVAATAALALGGCGFRPVHATGGDGQGAIGPVRVVAPEGRRGYLYARALRAKLGGAAGANGPRLETALRFGERETGITVEDDVTRFSIVGEAAWRLSEGGAEIASGVARAASAYTTLAAPYAARTAAADAERRVAEELAARVFLDLASRLGSADPA